MLHPPNPVRAAARPPGRHVARFYQHDADLLEEVADFIDAALRTGGVGVVIATPDHAAELRRRLGGLGSMRGRPHRFTGELLFLDAEQTLAGLLDGERIDAERFDDVIGRLIAEAGAGGRTVHAFGEMVSLLCARGLHEAAVQLEQLWNLLAKRASFSLLCGYPWGAFPTAEHATPFRHVCAAHGDTYADGCGLASRTSRRLRLRTAALQQQARALGAEVARRQAAEQTLRRREKELADAVENAAEGLATERRERDAAVAALERAHGERERLLAALSAADRAKDEFLAMLGHELRNPLSPIVTALRLMRLRGDAATAREQGIIQRQVEHLVRLVDDLLDISRVTRGTIELKVERVPLAQVLAGAVETSSALLEQRGHRLARDIEPDLHWEGDPVRLAQVIGNLLTNAARYTEPGGEIRLAAHRGPDERLCLRVADNGKGIAPDVLPHVFDLFFQGQRSIDRPEGGLGIGLALARTIVELHGGTVHATSAGPGRGSEFTVRLPGLVPRARAEAARPAAAAASHAGPRRRVMVVDDNADGAQALGRWLHENGHEVEVFGDPAAALDAVARFAPDAAILDIGLPVLDGYTLAARIRALPAGRDCRLIALTGYGQDADKARSAAAGFELHLVKPVNPEQVLAVLSRSPRAGRAPG